MLDVYNKVRDGIHAEVDAAGASLDWLAKQSTSADTVQRQNDARAWGEQARKTVFAEGDFNNPEMVDKHLRFG
jgi:putative N-acetylmannosamine-6-phosphate epimerase